MPSTSAPPKIHPHPTPNTNRKVSPIWTKMGHHMGEDGKLDLTSMVCMICNQKLSYKSSTSIGRYHLKMKHGITFEDNPAPPKQPTIFASMTSPAATKLSQKSKDHILDLLAGMVYIDGLPLNFVEGEGFR